MIDERTERQRKADEKLDEAAREAVAAYGVAGAFVTEWALVAHATFVDEQRDEADETHLITMHEIPTHRALGLLHVGRMHAEAHMREGWEA